MRDAFGSPVTRGVATPITKYCYLRIILEERLSLLAVSLPDWLHVTSSSRVFTKKKKKEKKMGQFKIEEGELCAKASHFFV